MLDGLLEAFHDAYLKVMVDDVTLQVLAEHQRPRPMLWKWQHPRPKRPPSQRPTKRLRPMQCPTKQMQRPKLMRWRPRMSSCCLLPFLGCGSPRGSAARNA